MESNGRGVLILTFVVAGALLVTPPPVAGEESSGVYPDPARYQETIDGFLEESVPAGAVVAVGSSSMRGWHATIREDLAPLTIVRRGFGGSNMNDVLHYLDQLVIRNRPRAVLLYEGDNDASLRIAPARVEELFMRIVDRVHAALPETRIYVLSVKPSIRRWAIWPQMQEMNRLLEARCAKDERLTYIDISAGMLGADGTPRPEIFVEDQLHMNDLGYRAWTAAVRPRLLDGEARYEQADPVR